MISNKAKYALKAMTILAANQERVLSAQEIAKKGKIPYKFLEAILTDLKNRKLLRSRRGASGGYELARPPGEMTAGEVIRAIEGPIAPLLCASLTGYRRCEDCVDEEACAVRSLMVDSRAALSSVLDRRSLAELAAFSQQKP